MIKIYSYLINPTKKKVFNIFNQYIPINTNEETILIYSVHIYEKNSPNLSLLM